MKDQKHDSVLKTFVLFLFHRSTGSLTVIGDGKTPADSEKPPSLLPASLDVDTLLEVWGNFSLLLMARGRPPTSSSLSSMT